MKFSGAIIAFVLLGAVSIQSHPSRLTDLVFRNESHHLVRRADKISGNTTLTADERSTLSNLQTANKMGGLEIWISLATSIRDRLRTGSVVQFGNNNDIKLKETATQYGALYSLRPSFVIKG